MSADDATGYADTEVDVSNWEQAPLPGIWPVPVERGGFQALWGRFEFQLPADFVTDGAGLSLGVVYRNDETYLNGERIGRTGEIGWGKPLLDPTMRVYPVPAGVLKPGETNVLTLRVQRAVGEAIEVVGPVEIGPFSELLADSAPAERLYRMVRGADLGVSAVFVVASLVLWLFVRQPDALALFVAEVLLFCLPLNLLLANYYGGQGEALTLINRILGVTAGVLSVVGLLVYVVLLFRHRLLRWCWALAAPCVLVLASRWILPESIVGPATSLGVFLTLASRASSMSILVLIVVVVGTALFKRKPGAGPIAVGLSTVLWSAAQFPLDNPALSPPGLWRWYFPLSLTWVFRFSMLLGAVSAYHGAQRSVNRLSKRVLSAQEQERQRLSRELHDGVAQSLHASKLEAQMLSRRAGEATPELADGARTLAENLGQAADELRDVSHDLQPTFLFDQTLAESIRWYAEQLQKRVGLRAEVESPDGADVPDEMKPHLYRIVQESLTNAIRH
ncbi:MAG: histidine kinase, partial [Planctomycetota bacterium]